MPEALAERSVSSPLPISQPDEEQATAALAEAALLSKTERMVRRLLDAARATSEIVTTRHST